MQTKIFSAALCCALSTSYLYAQTDIEEVIVTATVLRQAAGEAVASATVLSGDKLQNQLAQTVAETLEKMLKIIKEHS